ncbi:LysR family transcriptional regulator [Pseudomonas purpurea]|uniref:LysR family transcriptional regulator n=1 Tax=Pseudomonas purpurea TaxID=3136737 RepID=UPI00326527BA
MSVSHDPMGETMRRLPPLYALRAFELAARFGSFTQAADHLFLTQSAVSRHVKTLESHFGCSLFERKGPKITLTQAGQLLAQELKTGFRLIERACIITHRKEHALRLKAPSTLTMRWLLNVLDEFNALNAHEQVQLSSEWMDVDFINFDAEPFDCAVLLADGRFTDDLASVKLFDEWLVPVCSPEFLEQQASREEGIFAAELIHPSRDRRDWQRWLERTGLMTDVAWHKGKVLDTLELGICAAIQGRGLSMGDLALVGEELVKGSLVLPFNQAVSSGNSYYLVWPGRSGENTILERFKARLLASRPVIHKQGLEFLM